jgi:hypothetical protein
MSFAMSLGMTVEEATRAMGYPTAEATEPAITPADAQQDPEVRDGVARVPRSRRKSEN